MKQLFLLIFPISILMSGIKFWLISVLSVISDSVVAGEMDTVQIDTSLVIAALVYVVLLTILYASLTLFLEVRSNGYEPKTSQVLLTSLNFVPGLLLAGVLSSLAIFGPYIILLTISPLLAILGIFTGIFLYIRLLFVNFMIVVERLTPLEAIKRSFYFSSPIMLKTVAIVLLNIPIILVYSLAAKVIPDGILIIDIVTASLFTFFGLIIDVALFRLYMVSRPNKVDEEA
ncbi:hypothetical protein KT99_02552 [Shewanella benthica KT99]|uniref:Uncharacterized protein n=2 Tax=Shewanella benthica TaxID=43661 RepID=A9CXX4_9GAMM|nr:hypothetical protein KT99_02552 [Shewanella benthica KT99]